MKLYLLFILLSFSSLGQMAVLGNYEHVCLQDTTELFATKELPQELDNFDCLFIFSGSTSQFKQEDIDRITNFVQQGGGLYLGADNWPLQSESNQVTKAIYSKESYGEFEITHAEANVQAGNLHLNDIDTIPAGQTTVAFPLDSRLTVEAWIDDAPLILTGSLGEGRIVIDGGYSRFYCTSRSDGSDLLFSRILKYLCKE